MNLTEEKRYALYTVFDLCLQDGSELVQGPDLALRQRIPKKHLYGILYRLKHAGFVEARRGVCGGYRLARPPAQINVGEILRLFERRKPATGSGCGILADLWKHVDASVCAIVDKTTFADLAGQYRNSQRDSAPNWEI